MKKFENEDFKRNKFFNLIVGSFYENIHNFGHKYYGENFNEKGFYDNLNIILNQFYLFKNKTTSVIQLKKDFLQKKEKALNGSTILKDKIGDEITHINYSGNFVYYSILIHSLFYRCFYKEIEAKEKSFERIGVLLSNNYQEINSNPINHVVIERVSKVFKNSDLDRQDIADYINLLLNELKSHYAFEEENVDLNIPDIDEEELETSGNKIMLMNELGIIDFLIEKYDLKHKPSQVSKIICAYTGVTFNTVNGIINPIFNSANAQKNNPYKYPENVLKVKAKMVELGLSK